MAKKSAAAAPPIAGNEADLAEQLAAELGGEIGGSVAPDEVLPQLETFESLPATILVELPIGPLLPRAYLTDHVDLRLKPRHRRALQHLLRGLNARHAQLPGGKHVEKVGHAVEYMLEKIAEQLDAVA